MLFEKLFRNTIPNEIRLASNSSPVVLVFHKQETPEPLETSLRFASLGSFTIKDGNISCIRDGNVSCIHDFFGQEAINNHGIMY